MRLISSMRPSLWGIAIDDQPSVPAEKRLDFCYGCYNDDCHSAATSFSIFAFVASVFCSSILAA
jgi:hypothetical protein